MAAGVYMAYSNYGVQAGHITLGSTLVFVGISIYFSLRSRTWKRLMLRSAIDSKVNVVEEDKVKSG
ncbi:hypothetical protein KKC52_12540, partial [bacterium]|nr:hypothetical protein [bacterium]